MINSGDYCLSPGHMTWIWFNKKRKNISKKHPQFHDNRANHICWEISAGRCAEIVSAASVRKVKNKVSVSKSPNYTREGPNPKRHPMTIHALPMLNVNWLLEWMAKDSWHTLSAGLQYHHPLVSPRSLQVSGGGASERIQSWSDVRAPPLLVLSPLTEWAIWAAREPATGPSILVPCPLGIRPARRPGRAGSNRRSSLARQAGACFDDSSIQRGQKMCMSHFI